MGIASSSINEKEDNAHTEEMTFYRWKKPELGHFMHEEVLSGKIKTFQKEFFEILSHKNPKLICELLKYFSEASVKSNYQIVLEEPVSGDAERNSKYPSKNGVKFILTGAKLIQEALPEDYYQKFDLEVTSEEHEEYVIGTIETTCSRPYFSTPGMFNEAALHGYEGYDIDNIRWEWISFWSAIADSLIIFLNADRAGKMIYARFKIETREGTKLKATVVATVNSQDFILWNTTMAA